MTAKEAQLTELLSLSTRTLTHLSAAINTELDRQWQLVGELVGTPTEPGNSMEQVVLQSLEPVSDEH